MSHCHTSNRKPQGQPLSFFLLLTPLMRDDNIHMFVPRVIKIMCCHNSREDSVGDPPPLHTHTERKRQYLLLFQIKPCVQIREPQELRGSALEGNNVESIQACKDCLFFIALSQFPTSETWGLFSKMKTFIFFYKFHPHKHIFAQNTSLERKNWSCRMFLKLMVPSTHTTSANLMHLILQIDDSLCGWFGCENFGDFCLNRVKKILNVFWMFWHILNEVGNE
jgi:hypothetical protein